MKLTPWFPPDVKPVHIGWYHTGVAAKCPINDVKSEANCNWWWNGSHWTAFDGCAPIYNQNRYWRGLAENTEK